MYSPDEDDNDDFLLSFLYFPADVTKNKQRKKEKDG